MVLEMGRGVPPEELMKKLPVVTDDAPELRDESNEKIEARLVESSLDFIENKKEHDEAAISLAEHGLVKMRNILGSLMDEVTIFASSAMFLLGKKKRDMRDPDWETFHVAPGDLDGAVSTLEALKMIRERLARVDGVEFGHKDRATEQEQRGEFSGFAGQETAVLAGRIPVEFVATVKDKRVLIEVPYEFELFYKTRMVSEDDRKNPVLYHGFKILPPKALLRQYEENRDYEEKTGNTRKLDKRKKNINELAGLYYDTEAPNEDSPQE